MADKIAEFAFYGVMLVLLAAFLAVTFYSFFSSSISTKSRKDVRILFFCWTSCIVAMWGMLHRELSRAKYSQEIFGVAMSIFLIGMVGGLVIFALIAGIIAIFGPSKPKKPLD